MTVKKKMNSRGNKQKISNKMAALNLNILTVMLNIKD